MDEFELEQLRRHPRWVTILELYQQRFVQNQQQFTEFDGWVPRIHDVPEISSDELPGIHGKLIAFGFLKFDLAGRDGGIRYQLTPLGKLGINSSIPSNGEDSTTDSVEHEEVFAFRQ